ncbi:BgTH12-07784 [Blumeria graminis f. sp. triticale]|uniref:BgtE-3602 n=4 Tax=Blumeria graminis TaxID=34373 RepID=A0A9X9MQ34_BLUGR|nr:putative secreted effector protein [Blumeria graminis f. sp. tritici 96224]CAD6506557.1 BgTH12-07784 [Blumeria graminis f. sp. triticale]VDB96414.1 BgtE-3602 [Blumeria graminis f. sp. tritici]
MKALFAASIAGLPTLLLLVPTAYGLDHYRCESKQLFDYSVICGYAEQASFSQIQGGDPFFVSGNTYGAYRFTSHLPDGTPKNYLIQTVSVEPYRRLFEYNDGKWKLCNLI